MNATAAAALRSARPPAMRVRQGLVLLLGYYAVAVGLVGLVTAVAGAVSLRAARDG